jgi:hypothetical protein
LNAFAASLRAQCLIPPPGTAFEIRKAIGVRSIARFTSARFAEINDAKPQKAYNRKTEGGN